MVYIYKENNSFLFFFSTFLYDTDGPDEKYLHGPGAPRDCAPDQSCKYIVHGIVC